MDYSDLEVLLTRKNANLSTEETKPNLRNVVISLPGITAGILAFIMMIVVPHGRDHLTHVTICSILIAFFVCASNVFLF